MCGECRKITSKNREKLDSDQRRKIRDDLENPYSKVISNIDEWKKRKRSSLYKPSSIVSIPGTGNQSMISCFGAGDSNQFDLLHNQRYQTFETIPLFTQKMMGQPIWHRNRTETSAKNHRQRRPTMEINAVQGNRPRFKLKIKKNVCAKFQRFLLAVAIEARTRNG